MGNLGRRWGEYGAGKGQERACFFIKMSYNNSMHIKIKTLKNNKTHKYPEVLVVDLKDIRLRFIKEWVDYYNYGGLTGETVRPDAYCCSVKGLTENGSEILW